MLGLCLHPDPQADRVVVGQVQVHQRDRGNLHSVDIGAIGRHPPAFELAILAALELPPVRRIDPALVSEIPRAHPGADFRAIDR
ncbi:hypothetical protein D3C72_2160790 [compost metagenome]